MSGPILQVVKQLPAKEQPMSAEGWVIVITVLLIMLAVGWYVVGWFRNMYYEGAPDPGSYLGTFQELRDKGVLEENEYKKLKETLSANKSLTGRSTNEPAVRPGPLPETKEPEVEFEPAAEPDPDQPDSEE